MTDGASLPNNESQEQYVVKFIEERLQKMSAFSKKCEGEAGDASDRKRNNN